MNRASALLILAALVAGLGSLIWARRRAVMLRGKSWRFLPASAPPPSWTARVAEAAVLAAAALPILIYTATNGSTGGLLLTLDELRPEYARANVLVFAAAAAGVAGALALCLLWRTWAGVVLAAAMLSAYGLVLNGPSVPCQWLVPIEMVRPIDHYTIQVNNVDVPGAELWVNGVHLGKLPVQTTLEKFRRKVPHWPDGPVGYAEGADEVVTSQYSGGPSEPQAHQRKRHQWIRFQIPQGPDWPDDRNTWLRRARESVNRTREQGRPEEQERTYYARVWYAGEWGLAGDGGGGGGGGGRLTFRFHTEIEAVFPQRQQRLEKLLAQARLADYQVGPAWFEVMETYGADGWLALLEASEKEPELHQVFDAWVTRRYNLAAVKDADSAWAVFEKLCDEAPREQQYYTCTLAGRALELIAPRLDAERLVRLAEGRIARIGSYQWHEGTAVGRLQFGFNTVPGGVHVPLGSYNGTGSRRGESMAMSDYVLAHAIWMLDERLKAERARKPNIIQQRITPALIRWHYGDGFAAAMQIALHFGGPALDDFLTRQDWRSTPGHFGPNSLSIEGADVNRWLYLLAGLPSPAGREFRVQHASAVAGLAETILTQGHGMEPQEHLDFLFLDLDLGEQSPAMEFWPRFLEIVNERRSFEPLLSLWTYLARMEPLSTPEMYAQAWRKCRIDYLPNLSKPLDLLPAEKRRAVIDAVIAEVDRSVENVELDNHNRSPRRAKESLSRSLESYGIALTETDKIAQAVASLKDRPEKLLPASAAGMGHAGPNHLLVAALAASKEPKLRLLTMEALRWRPTPANRGVLAALANDQDQAVSAAARDVQTWLAELAADPPTQFVSNPCPASQPADP